MVSGWSASGRVGCMVGVSGYKVPSMQEALGIIVEHDNMS